MKRRAYLSIALLLPVAVSSVSCVPVGSISKARENACADDLSESTAHTAPPAGSRLVRYSPEGSGLSLELPGEPRPLDIAMPEEVRGTFKQVTAYTYRDRHLFLFLCRYGSLRSSVTSQELSDLSAGFIASLKRFSGLSSSDYSTETQSPCKISMTGTYKQNDIPARFEGFARSKQGNAWLVVATYPLPDTTAYALSHYVMESVKLD